MADEPIEVLFALQPNFDLLDMAGPMEALSTALHDQKDKSEYLPYLPSWKLLGSSSSLPSPLLPPRTPL